jgi:hypothetical protein
MTTPINHLSQTSTGIRLIAERKKASRQWKLMHFPNSIENPKKRPPIRSATYEAYIQQHQNRLSKTKQQIDELLKKSFSEQQINQQKQSIRYELDLLDRGKNNIQRELDEAADQEENAHVIFLMKAKEKLKFISLQFANCEKELSERQSLRDVIGEKALTISTTRKFIITIQNNIDKCKDLPYRCNIDRNLNAISYELDEFLRPELNKEIRSLQADPQQSPWFKDQLVKLITELEKCASELKSI